MILFVGDKPSPKMKPGAKPFEGAACEKRLLMWQRFLAPEYFKPAFKQTRDLGYILGLFTYNSHTAEDIKDIRLMSKCNCKVIALGNSASDKLSSAGITHFKLPHPSGRNRQINNKKFIRERLKACKQWLKENYAPYRSV